MTNTDLQTTQDFFKDFPFSQEIWYNNYKGPDDNNIFDTFHRLAKATAVIEETPVRTQIEQNYYRIFSEMKFIYGGRIMANLGIKARKATTLFNCFPGGTSVLTQTGYKNIEDLTTNDIVLSHTGRWNKITNIMNRKYIGDIDVYISTTLNKQLRVTPEHPFYQGSEKWIESKNNNVLTFLNNIKNNFINSSIDLCEYFMEEILQGIVKFDDNSIWTINQCIGGNGAQQTMTCAKINRFIEISDDFLYVMGRYIGDGSIFNTSEYDIADKCKNILEKSFGLEINKNMSTNGLLYLRKNNNIISQFLYRSIGRYGYNKHIPTYVWKLTPEKIKNILLGIMDSDGMVDSRGSLLISLANEPLIDEIKILFNCIGLICKKTNTPFNKNNGCKTHRQAYTLRIPFSINREFVKLLTKKYSDNRILMECKNKYSLSYTFFDDCILTKKFIKQKEKYNGLVYNISVENDESYIVEGCIVHNCFIDSVYDRKTKNADSLSNIYKMLHDQAQTLKSEGGYGINFSWLRPRGSYVKGIGGRTPGVLKFMELWDKSSEIITMGAETPISERKKDEKNKIRKGAQMGVLSIWHPEIEDFIVAKQTPNRLTKFNISVGITKNFMSRLEESDEKIIIELKNGESHILKKTEKIDIDGIIMTAEEYKNEKNNVKN